MEGGQPPVRVALFERTERRMGGEVRLLRPTRPHCLNTCLRNDVVGESHEAVSGGDHVGDYVGADVDCAWSRGGAPGTLMTSDTHAVQATPGEKPRASPHPPVSLPSASKTPPPKSTR